MLAMKRTAILTGHLTAKSFATLAVGAKFPTATLLEGTPKNTVNTDDLFAKKKVVVFGVPGAFTGTCNKQLPAYIQKAEELKKKGIDEVVCITVNDPFVAQAWADANQAAGKVRVLADMDASLAKATGLDINILGGVRNKRYSAIIENGIVKKLNIEPNEGTGLTCSAVDPLLKDL